MSEQTTTPKLTDQFSKAVVYAEEKHHTQTRKGGANIPYIGHLLAVAGLVLEAGGNETQAIAALLHDAVSDDTILVSLADKLDNARSTLRDLRIEGPVLWQRFTVHDPLEHLWYYESLLSVYRQRSRSWMVSELERVLDELKRLVPEQRALS